MPQPKFTRWSTLTTFGLMLLVGACNFRPMYGTLPGGGSLTSVLSPVDIEPLGTREGQKLRNELIFLFTGGGNPAPPQYRLTITVASAVGALTVQRLGGLPTSEMVVGTASFSLKRISDGTLILSDSLTARASYDRSVQRFAALRSRRDAEDRAMTMLAEMIRTRIAAQLVSGVPASPASSVPAAPPGGDPTAWPGSQQPALLPAPSSRSGL